MGAILEADYYNNCLRFHGFREGKSGHGRRYSLGFRFSGF